MAFLPWRHKRAASTTESSSLGELRQEMDRLFDAFMRDPLGSLSERLAGSRAWSPPVDIAENDLEVIVRAETPGIDPKDLDVSVSGSVLTLSGVKREGEAESGCHWIHVETRGGPFRRAVELPSGVDTEQVSAEHLHGVLIVRLRKSPAALARKVEVKTATQGS